MSLVNAQRIQRISSVVLAVMLSLSVAAGAQGGAALSPPSRVDPLRSVATALVKPNALLVIDLSSSMQCDLQEAFWPAGQELLFGSKDKRTCVDQAGLPTGVRTGEFFEPNATVKGTPILADDFSRAGWSLEYNSKVTGAAPLVAAAGYNPLAPAADCATGSPLLIFDDRKVEWTISNATNDTLVISEMAVSWPIANNRLEKVKVDGETIHKQKFDPNTAVIRAPWEGKTSERSWEGFELKTLRLEFERDAVADLSLYQITVTFENGCSVTFGDTGTPPPPPPPPPPGPGPGPGGGGCVDIPGSTSCGTPKPCLLCQAGGVVQGAYRWRWHDASRLAVVKNLLGDSMEIETLDVPMSMENAPTPWTEVSTCVPSQPERLSVRIQEPFRLVDTNFDKINFGLGVFSCLSCHNHNIGDYANEDPNKPSDPKPGCKVTNTDFADACSYVADPQPDPDFPLNGGKPVYKTMVPINTDDLDLAGQEFVRDAVNAYLKPTTETTVLTDPETGAPVSITGLTSYTATPTPCALRCVRFDFERDVFPNDAKLGVCKRRNYVILITDGQSTEIDKGHNIKSCGGFMPWDMSDELYSLTLDDATAAGDPEGAVRTFVIGLSTQTTSGTARVELNRIAFSGRTDASDQEGGVGMAGDDPHWTVFDPAQNYAYFATNAQELAAALRKIVASIAAVDLATSPPVASRTDTVTTFNGDPVGLLTSSQFPEAYGHLRMFNLARATTDPDYLLWDAGEGLNTRNLQVSPRTIYTSDPTSVPPHQLVPLVPGNLDSIAALRSLLGLAVSTDAMAGALLDFLHGLPVPEDPQMVGSPTRQRPWRLGDIVNSTPAIRSSAPKFFRFPSHADFAITHSQRHPLVFVGSNDLMLHAFDLVDGDEVWAYLPPNLLPSLVAQYKQWVSDDFEFMGQPFGSLDHIYGVASSPRLADIQDEAGRWLTALITAEGPGGESIFALDVTSAYPGRTVDSQAYQADQGYDAVEPFRVLWVRSSTDTGFEDLGESWSVPAVGYGARPPSPGAGAGFGWLAAFGSSYGLGNQGKFLHVVDAFTGELISKQGASPLADRATQLVSDNFLFADTLGYSSDAVGADAPLSAEVQADLAGQIWGVDMTDASYAHARIFDVGATQPIYFAPSVATYRRAGPYMIAAYASGTFDETDRDVNGSKATLNAKLFISLKTLGDTTTSTLEFDVDDPTTFLKPDGTAFSVSTRPVSSPLTFIPKKGNPKIFFTLFDPTPTAGDCFGRSFIVIIEFVPDPTDLRAETIIVVPVGQSKVSGFALGEDKVVVGQSGTGGEPARIVPVENLDLILPTEGLSVVHWKELF